MDRSTESVTRENLLDRRSKLEKTLKLFPEDPQLSKLLGEVDAAIKRVNDRTYGLCETCKDPIEKERLIADPLVQFCLEHMTPSQQRALEQDLELASRIQDALLPEKKLQDENWEVYYHYEGARLVSGDYCDLLHFGGYLYFTLGDVSGKGVAASMLMAHLNAMFRSLVSLELPIDQVIMRAGRMFCESTLPTHFATLVCGKAASTGEVEICNAGHLPPILLQGSKMEKIYATGIPLGMFCEESYSVNKLRLERGDSIFLYTDGLSEAQNSSGAEYGMERLPHFLREHHALPPEQLVSLCVEDLNSFSADTHKKDDVTIMIIRRSGQGG